MDYTSPATAITMVLGLTLKYKKVTLEEILALGRVWITLRQQMPSLWCPDCTLKQQKVTLEEILALRHVWITLRQQRGNCLKPEGLSFDTLLK